VVTVSIRTVGLLLVTALLVVPAATARNVARDAGSMFRWAMLVGLVSGISGVLISFSWLAHVGTGAVIILSAAFLFAVSFAGRRA
jgi:zinc transport system permease protein